VPVASIKQILPSDKALWQAVLTIYRAAFPDWEREPESTVTERATAGRYAVYCATNEHAELVGFYILDINLTPNYATFCFLAVAERYRGQGYGTKLCCDAISRFHNEYKKTAWLLIEAEDRQALFYGKHGFKKIDIPYQIPMFDSLDVTPMHLMLISTSPNQTHIPGDCLMELIQHIFITGYQLNANDARKQQQIALIPKQAQLLSWPQ